MRTLIWYEGRGEAAEVIAAQFASALRQHDERAVVALALGEHNRNFADPAVSVYRLPSAPGLARLAVLGARWRRLRQILAEFRPDLVIIPMNFFSAWPFTKLVAAAGARLCYVVHDPEPHSGDYYPGWQKHSQRLLCRQSDVIVALSAYSMGRMQALLPVGEAAKLTLMPLAALVPSKRSEPRRAPVGAVRFLFLGRLLRYKGLDLLGSAAGLLNDRDDWTLTIAGSGRLEDQVRAMFADNKHVDLSLLRHVDSAEYAGLLASHDVMVCPYSEATQSGILCDAMSAGMPAIVTPVGALPEQVGDAGVVMDAVTPAALASAMASFIDDKLHVDRLSARALAVHDAPALALAMRNFLDRLVALAR